MPTECSPALFEFAPVEGRACGRRLRRRGDHLERRGAAARRHGPGDRLGPALRRLLPRRPRAGADRARGGDPGRPAGVRHRARPRGPGRPRPTPARPGAGRARRQAGGAPARLRAAGRQEHAEPAGARARGRARPLPPDRPRRARRSRRCSWTCSSTRTARRRGRSSSTWTPPTCRCTGTRRAASSTATTTAYCYLPLYVFCGRHLLAAKLRRADIDASAGAVEEVARIVGRIRARWPRVRILLRADSGFAREALMAWCEANRVDFVFGLARNPRLVEELAIDLAWAEEEAGRTGQPARRFRDFRWSTLDSWSRRRRVIGKAEWTRGEANPRFVVTSLKPRRDRRAASSTSGSTAPAATWRTASRNASSTCSPAAPRPPPCAPTSCACGSPRWPTSCSARCAASASPTPSSPRPPAARIRLALLKIGALVRLSVRRIKLAMASAHPFQDEFALAHARLTAAVPA